MKNKNKERLLSSNWDYILIAGNVLAIIAIIYFAFTTKNVAGNAVSLALVMALTFPLGLIISRILFSEINISESVILGICIGCPFSAGIWGLFAFARLPMSPAIYIPITFVIPICLLIVYRKSFCFKNREFKISEICVPIFVLLAAFLGHSLMMANSNVPPDVDAQGSDYVQFLMKYQGYPAVYPFLNEVKAHLNYPPCFNVIVVLLSKLKMSLVFKECMAITVVCGSFFALAVCVFAYNLFKRNLLLAFIAGIITLNRAYLTQYNDGNTTEMLSFLAIAGFLIFLHRAFNAENRKSMLIVAGCGGFLFSVSAFSQTEIFNWYAISLGAFFALYLVAKRKNYFNDYMVLGALVGTSLIIVVPWLVTASGNYKTIDFENFFSQAATHLFPALRYWHSPVFLILSAIGIGFLFYRREKLMVYLGFHALIMAGLIVHWKVYQLIGFEWFKFTPTPYWSLGANGNFRTPSQFPNTFTIGWFSFTIVFPIATAYTLWLITELVKKTKSAFMEKGKVMVILIVIFLAVFEYNEYKKYLRYPEWLLETDYQALTWFHDNTTFDNCFILNPRNPIDVGNGNLYWSSDWNPIVSERRCVSARSLDTGRFQMNIEENDLIDRKALVDIYSNILRPDAHTILKQYNITHIFISAFHAGSLYNDYAKVSFLELVHKYQVPNLGTALIFEVK